MQHKYTMQRGSNYQFDSVTVTKFLIFQELNIFEKIEVTELKILFEKSFGSNSQTGWVSNDKETESLEQLNKVLAFFKTRKMQDFRQFLRQKDPKRKFQKLFKELDSEISKNVFSESVAQIFMCIIGNGKLADIGNEIFNEICEKDNLNFRQRRMDTLFNCNIRSWSQELKQLLAGLDFNTDLGDKYLQILIKSKKQQLSFNYAPILCTKF